MEICSRNLLFEDIFCGETFLAIVNVHIFAAESFENLHFFAYKNGSGFQNSLGII